MISFFFVVCSLGGLVSCRMRVCLPCLLGSRLSACTRQLFFGFLFYYEPRTISYKNISIPVLHGFDVVAYFSLGKW